MDLLQPDSLKVEGNPFECMGIVHNRMLFYIKSDHDPEDKLEDFVSGDETTVDQFLSLYSGCHSISTQDADKVELFIETKFDSIYQARLSAYSTMDNSEILSSAGNAGVDIIFCESVWTQALIVKDNTHDIIEVVKYINEEIVDLLDTAQTVARDSKLAFLTVLKHSAYFWQE